MNRKLKKLSKQLDIKSLVNDPLIEVNLKTNSSELHKKENVILEEILKDIPMYNNVLYVEYDRENNIFLLEEDEETIGKR